MSQAAGVRCWLRLFFLSLVAGAPRAQAQSPPVEEAVRFEYTAPAECPDAAVFTARVRERTAHGRPAEPQELAHNFDVRINADAAGFVGSVAFLDDAGTSVSRRVHGEQCDAVVTSLALITALALDASLRASASPAPSAEPQAPAVVEPASPATPPPAPAAAPPPAFPKPARPFPMRGRFGVEGGYDTLLEAYGIGLLAQLDWPSGLALRLVGHHSYSERTVDEGRRAGLRLMGVESSFCPARFGRDIAFYPCAALDLGLLTAEGLQGDQLVSGSSATTFWAALGPALRLAWEPDGPSWLELQAQLEFPLAGHEFVFEQPPASVFEVNPVTSVSFGVGVATGLRF